MAKNDTTIKTLRKVVMDVFLLAFLGICIYTIQNMWSPFERGFFCNDESLMYPYKPDTVTVTVLYAVGLTLPIFSFLVCEWAVLRRSRDNKVFLGVSIPAWIQGFYCVLVSFGFGVCFTEITTNIAKVTIGRPRPHFFDICQPSVDCNSPGWTQGYINSDMYTCKGSQTDKFEDMRKSFLSGHSSWSAFTMIYLVMYLERRMTWNGCRGLRHTVQFAVLMLSWFCALSRISDFKHHWSDVLAGYALGTVFAIISFRFGTDIVPEVKNQTTLPQYDTTVNGASRPQPMTSVANVGDFSPFKLLRTRIGEEKI